MPGRNLQSIQGRGPLTQFPYHSLKEKGKFDKSSEESFLNTVAVPERLWEPSKWVLFWISLVSLKSAQGPLSCPGGFFIMSFDTLPGPACKAPAARSKNRKRGGSPSEVKFDPLRQGEFPAVINGVGLPAHIDFPGIGPRFPAAARFFFPSESPADFGS